MKLNEIADQYDQPTMRESVRLTHRRVLRESNVPLTGAYWWIPVPVSPKRPSKLVWKITEFYDQHYGDTLHERRWPEVVDALQTYWNLTDISRIRGSYSGLPRGRVVEQNGTFIVYHGGDSPGPMSTVLSAFNLAGLNRVGRVRVVEDDHERMIPDDVGRVQVVLGDLGLIAPEVDLEDE